MAVQKKAKNKYLWLEMLLLEGSVPMWLKGLTIEEKIIRNPSVSLSPTLAKNKKVEHLGMATGRDGDEFRYPIPIPAEKIHPHTQTGYQTFVLSPSPPGNGYNLVPMPVPVF